MRADESNGVICFAIKDTFHVEKTFVPKCPIEMAGMIELGKKNTWSDRIRNGTERKEKLSRSLSNDYCSLKKKLF